MYFAVIVLALTLSDADLDGIPDAYEQYLLETFAPRWQMNTKECDAMPAQFHAGKDPVAAEQNGTIYGQAFPYRTAEGRELIELHYYHLWRRDCGRAPHDLDVEHVSALIDPTGTPAALYWYAAAHEGTVCDGSNAARASSIEAETAGARIWISRGKHASFLDPGLCTPGCGSDSCAPSEPMSAAALINVGEPGAPLNGSEWTSSPRWRFAEKMETDFTIEVLAKLDGSGNGAADGVRGPTPPTKAIILAGNSAVTGGKVAAVETTQALGKTVRHTGNAVFRALRAVGRALGLAPKP